MAESSAARQPPSIAASAPLRMLSPATRHILRAAPAALQAAGDAIGMSLSSYSHRHIAHLACGTFMGTIVVFGITNVYVVHNSTYYDGSRG